MASHLSEDQIEFILTILQSFIRECLELGEDDEGPSIALLVEAGRKPFLQIMSNVDALTVERWLSYMTYSSTMTTFPERMAMCMGDLLKTDGVSDAATELVSHERHILVQQCMAVCIQHGFTDAALLLHNTPLSSLAGLSNNNAQDKPH